MMFIDTSSTTTASRCILQLILLVSVGTFFVQGDYNGPSAVVTPIHCGCPEKCNNATVNSAYFGQPFTCRERIEWMMNKHLDPEANACALSSVDPTKSDEENVNKFCPEECHPEACGSYLLVDPNPHPKVDCGCPETCTPAELNKITGSNSFTCLERIDYFMFHYKDTEFVSCAAAAREGKCSMAACNPETCGSDLEEEKVVLMKEDPSMSDLARAIDADLLVLLGVGGGAVALFLFMSLCFICVRRSRRRKAALSEPSVDGIFRDSRSKEDDDEEGGHPIEMSFYVDEAGSTSPKRDRSCIKQAPPSSMFKDHPSISGADEDKSTSEEFTTVALA